MARTRPQPVGTLGGVGAVVRAGTLAGLLGGALMALVATRLALASGPESWHPLRHIAASLFGVEALDGGAEVVIFGFAIHLATSVAWGIAFASAAGARPSAPAALGLGLVASMVIMVIMTFGVLPAANPLMYVRVMEGLPYWTVAHLAYGTGLAFAPWLRRRAAARSAAAFAEAGDETLPRRADVR